MSVRAKMHCTAITEHEGGGKTLRLETRYDDSIPEDRRFTTATPWGSIKMQVNNPAALAQFEIGGDYYLDFTRIE